MNISQAAPLQQIDYVDLFEEYRVRRVHFRMLYPGEQDTPLCSVEMCYLVNYNFDASANPATMLMSNLDDYCISPIPASHMVEGCIDLSKTMAARGAVWSKVGSNDYYGKFASSTTPFFVIRTNFFGTTVS